MLREASTKRNCNNLINSSIEKEKPKYAYVHALNKNLNRNV